MEDLGIGIAAFWGTVHLLRVMVNRGLVSPNEVESIYSSMIEGLQMGDAAIAAKIEALLEQPFAEIRDHAKEVWRGGPHDPERPS